MDQLASEHADWIATSTEKDVGVVQPIITKVGTVRIVNVEYGAARELCITQGIHQLPTIHMYITTTNTTDGPSSGNQRVRTKVQDFPCPPGEFQRVRDLTKGYIQQRQCATFIKDAASSMEKKLEANATFKDTVSNNEKKLEVNATLNDVVRNKEKKLEAKLDAGHRMIQSSLLLSSSLDENSSGALKEGLSMDTTDSAVDAKSTTTKTTTRVLPRLWRRFRP
jgi:hypothetical protein